MVADSRAESASLTPAARSAAAMLSSISHTSTQSGSKP